VFLGEAAGVEHQHGVGVGEVLGHVPAQLAHDRLVVPGAGADEVLDGLTRAFGLGGDRLGSLGLQVAQLALQDDGGQFPVLLAVEARQVAMQELPQPPGAAAHGGRRDVGVGEQLLSRGVG
jgi:hypothetical protein